MLLKFDNFPHLLFYGCESKKQKIRTFIGNFFNVETLKLSTYEKEFQISSKTTKISLVKSNYHVEINVGDLGMNDKTIVPDLIKEVGTTKSMITKLRIVVVLGAEKLTMHAQQALRRVMEKYTENCRIILSSDSHSKIIDPLRSRCFCIRVSLPTKQEIREKLNIPDSIKLNSRSLIKNGLSSKSKNWNPPDWELYITRLANHISKEKNLVKAILISREFVLNLLNNGVPPEKIFRKLTIDLIKISPKKHYDIIHWASHFQYRSTKGQKPIYHLEAFIVKYLSIRNN